MNFVLFYTIHLCAYFNIHLEVLYQTFFCYMYFEAFDVINNDNCANRGVDNNDILHVMTHLLSPVA